MVAWWTGGAWVLYFADAPTLVKHLATLQAPFIAYAFIGILTFTTYTLAGHMREQVCLYMCPWPRIQAALTDEYALNVTYRYDRGEPRCAVSKAKEMRARGEPAGDCTNCKQCVHVCPTGVDIRNGADLGCIQCGLCIDACDAMMTKLGRPTGLIGYDTDINIKRRMEGKPGFVKIMRMRTVLYAAIIAIAGGIMIFTLATRDSEGISSIHDRNPMSVRLSNGAVRNGYTIRIVNKQLRKRDFILAFNGLPASLIDFVGVPPREDGQLLIDVGPDTDARSARAGDRLRRYAAGLDPDRVPPDRCGDRRAGRGPRPLLRTLRESTDASPCAKKAPRLDRPRRAALAGRIFRRRVRGQRRAGACRDFDLRRRRDAQLLQGRPAIRARSRPGAAPGRAALAGERQAYARWRGRGGARRHRARRDRRAARRPAPPTRGWRIRPTTGSITSLRCARWPPAPFTARRRRSRGNGN